MEVEKAIITEKLEQSTLLSMEYVDLGYDSSPILKDINIQVHQGLCLGILGPNGTGKTTLIRGILGILKPLKGKIIWDRRAYMMNKGHIGYVPQKERLDPAYPLTILEVVQMGTFAERPWSPRLRPSQKESSLAALDRVGMSHLSRMLFSECSGGQRQRVLIARALATDPHMLILDEPTTGIDLTTRKQIITILEDFHKNHRISILIVSQHFGPMVELFEEVIWVQGGKAVTGDPKLFLSDEYIARAFGSFKDSE